MFKRLVPFLLLALALLVPTLASAGTLSPSNGGVWTLYVSGNGSVVYNVLLSIKLLMVPDGGSTGFNSLLMFLATAGFLVLAVQAGFDPGKNLMKMFSYIIVVSAVHIMTMQITADIEVNDPITNYDNVATGVPALVGVPAAIVSEVGRWFAETMETYYGLPDEMTLTKGGTFNLFGKMLQESNEYVISNDELKKSLTAYISDCTVPAMALGTISATQLTTATNMTNVLAKAANHAILTKYWEVGTPDPTSSNGLSYTSPINGADGTYTVTGGLGTVMTCNDAWTQLSTDLQQHATDLMNSTSAAWASTGVLVPFEQGMSAMMAMASSGGANPFANYSKPEGFILQQAMLNSMNGSFRSAAAAIGNNDVLMSVSIAQAEQAQKTSWFTAARVFDNMMGYVYTTLQAFIFAIVPIVIIALMVPGLGRPIFTNYAQILVWMTLWQPMLTVVNYLITLFGQGQVGTTMALGSGISMSNKYAFQTSTNDLMLAAQFLGTSVPLLAWGLVKGSMAFTEFISHGIGSSMAQQAGASASTGNLSMGNMSMDNTSMNKYNTAMSSAVGAQTTMGYTGSMQSAVDDGGSSHAAYGQQQTRVVSTGLSVSQQTSLRDGASASESASQTLSNAQSQSKDNRLTKSSSEVFSALSSSMDAATKSYNDAKASGDSKAIEKAKSAMNEVGNAAMTTLEASARAQGRVKFDTEKELAGKAAAWATGVSAEADLSIGGGVGASANSSLAQRASNMASYRDGKTWSDGTSTSTGGNHSDSAAQNAQKANQKSRDETWSKSDQDAVNKAIASAAQKSHEASTAMSATADSSERSSRAGAYRDVDDRALASVEKNIRGDASAIATSAHGQAGSPLTGTPDAQFNALTSGAKAARAGSASNEAAGALASTGVGSGMPSAPRAVGGGDVAKQVQAGQKAADQSTAAPGAPIAAGEQAADGKFADIGNTGALSYGGDRIGAALKNAKNEAKELGDRLGGTDPGMSGLL